MHRRVLRGGVCTQLSNVRLTAASDPAAEKSHLKVYKQCQTDVLWKLRKGCAHSIRLALKPTRDFSSHQLCRHKHTDTASRSLISSSAAKYSRYSASTIMNSYCKELSLTDYDVIGFDLDGTLLRYNLVEMTSLIYDALKDYLVNQKGYSSELMAQKLDFDFLQKGLMLDGPRGNVLKLSNEATILRASHGTQLLSDADIVATYGRKREWDIATAFYKDPLSTWNGPAAKQMRTLLDYFDTPSALVFAQAVDIVDKVSGPDNKPKEYKVWEDLHDALMHIYSRDNFGNDQSLYFKAMRADPERYVLPSSPKVLEWLQKLRAANKKIFLLTGSNIDFADLTATRALGHNWQQQFDYILTYAKKPGFFTQQRPFLAVDKVNKREIPDSGMNLQEDLKSGEVYSQGNWHQLHRSIAKLLHKDANSARALYFGDNIIQDIYTPVKHRDFDTVAIAEEMYLLEKAEYPFKAMLASNFWDSYFVIEKTPTLWSGFIANYAQICVSSMDQIAEMSPNERLVCTNVNGFYPTLPKQLESSDLTSCWNGGV